MSRDRTVTQDGLLDCLTVRPVGAVGLLLTDRAAVPLRQRTEAPSSAETSASPSGTSQNAVVLGPKTPSSPVFA
jgi:hypothetical protein